MSAAAQFGISDALVYQPKPRAALASKVRINQRPLNGHEFFPGDVVQISIPSGTRGQFLNTRQSYLKFTINNTRDQDLILDYSASSVIRLLEVTYGSSVLEYVDDYNALVATLEDATGDPIKHQTAGSVLEGYSSSRTGATIAKTTGKLTVCIPLCSGILGTMQSRYLPIQDMVRNHLKLQLTLAGLVEPFTHGTTAPTTGTWSLTDVEFVCEVVQMNSETAKAISALNASGYRIPVHTFSLHSNVIPDGSQNANILISGNYRSLKTLISIFRLQSNVSSSAAKFITTRVNPYQNAGRWRYEVGGVNMPQQDVQSDPEAFAELMKAFHSFGSAQNMGSIAGSTWSAANGTYIHAQDLEAQSHKSSVSEGGADVSSSTIHLVAQFAGPIASGKALRVSTWTHQDAVLFLDPTGMAQTLF